MTRRPTLPFTVRRSSDVITSGSITSTTETTHGLLRLEADRLVVQWRLHRSTDRIGPEIRTDVAVGEVREAVISLAGLGGAVLRRPWWALGRRVTLVLLTSDLRALDGLAGAGGLQLAHPGQLELRIRPADRDLALEFVADLALAIGERALRLASGESSGTGSLTP